MQTSFCTRIQAATLVLRRYRLGHRTSFRKVPPVRRQHAPERDAAMSMSTNSDKSDMVDYNNELRNGIFEAGLASSRGFKSIQARACRSHVPFVLEFIERVAADLHAPKPSCAMVGRVG